MDQLYHGKLSMPQSLFGSGMICSEKLELHVKWRTDDQDEGAKQVPIQRPLQWPEVQRGTADSCGWRLRNGSSGARWPAINGSQWIMATELGRRVQRSKAGQTCVYFLRTVEFRAGLLLSRAPSEQGFFCRGGGSKL